MIDKGTRPHVSLVIGQDADVGALTAALRRFAAERAPLPARLESVGAFGGEEGVTFLAPVVTPALLELHARAQAIFRPLMRGDWPHYRVGRWVPHCTLGCLLAADAIGPALARARAHLPLPTGRLEAVGLWAFEGGPAPPGRLLAVAPLSGGAGGARPRQG